MGEVWTAAELRLLVELHQQGHPLPEVAGLLGRSYNAVCSKASQNGLTFERHDRNRLNERAFRNLTPDTAWLLGLLFADGGWSGKRHTLTLSSTDSDLVYKMRAILESEAPIYTVIPDPDKGCFGKKPQYRSSVNSKALLDDLDALGIPRLKRERTCFPTMPPQLIRHFVRGIFDGDGGVSHKASVQAYFAGPSAFADVLRRQVNTEGIATSRLYLPKQTTGLGTFHIWGAADLQRLFNYLYTDADTYGERKHTTFTMALLKLGMVA